MLRLLMDCQCANPDGTRPTIAVSYDQQWRSLWKAQAQGYVDQEQILTPSGKAYIEKELQRLKATDDDITAWKRGYPSSRRL